MGKKILVIDSVRLDLETLEALILKHYASSEYKQACIVILREIFKSFPSQSETPETK